jgi:putative Mn2+ efflux pump MntP
MMELGIDVMSLILLSIGLAMDAFSVATVTGFGLGELKVRDATKMSFSFGLAHTIMPIMGWLMGATVVRFISSYDHWVAFILLAFVGIRMMLDGLKNGDDKVDPSTIINTASLLLFTLAVSIDSLAVGLSFSLERISILIPSLFMGAGTLTFTLLGLFLGNRTGQAFGKKAQILGGSVLVFIGLRVVASHHGFTTLLTALLG